MKRLAIQCSQCDGRGEIPLPKALSDVLHIVKNHARGISCGVRAAEVLAICADRKRVKISAINNRLVKLESLGLVSREKHGKEFLWSPAFGEARKLKALKAARAKRWAKGKEVRAKKELLRARKKPATKQPLGSMGLWNMIETEKLERKPAKRES